MYISDCQLSGGGLHSLETPFEQHQSTMEIYYSTTWTPSGTVN